MKSKMQDVVERTGKTLKEALKEEFERQGTISRIAAKWGVSQGTVSAWLLREGLEVKQVLVEKEAMQ